MSEYSFGQLRAWLSYGPFGWLSTTVELVQLTERSAVLLKRQTEVEMADGNFVDPKGVLVNIRDSLGASYRMLVCPGEKPGTLDFYVAAGNDPFRTDRVIRGTVSFDSISLNLLAPALTPGPEKAELVSSGPRGVRKVRIQ